jgi:hypothetical protein
MRRNNLRLHGELLRSTSLLLYRHHVAERQQSTGSLTSAPTAGVPEAKTRVFRMRLLTNFKFTSFVCVVAELRGTVSSCLISASSRSLSLTNLSDLGPYRDFGRWTRGWLGGRKAHCCGRSVQTSSLPDRAGGIAGSPPFAQTLARKNKVPGILALRYFAALV